MSFDVAMVAYQCRHPAYCSGLQVTSKVAQLFNKWPIGIIRLVSECHSLVAKLAELASATIDLPSCVLHSFQRSMNHQWDGRTCQTSGVVERGKQRQTAYRRIQGEFFFLFFWGGD